MQITLVVILLLTFGGCLWLVSFCCMRQDREKTLYFMYATLAMCFYVIGNIAEVLAATPEARMTALHVQNAGIPIIAPLFMLCTMSVFRPTVLRKWMLPAVLAYGAAMLVIVLTNDWHMLYYTSIETVPIPGGSHLRQIGGPLYAVHQVISAVSILISYVIAIRRAATGTKKLRKQMWLMIGCSAFAFAANVLNVTHALPYDIDPVPIVGTVALIIISFGMSQYKLMDLVPIASYNAVHTMEDAVVVLDDQMMLQYWNLSAVRLFAQLSGCIVGDDVNRLEAWPSELRLQSVPGEVTFCLPDIHGTEKYFRAKISHVLYPKSEMVGWSYVMRDITDNINMMHQLEELATTDPLTGIYNRRQFMNMVRHEMEVSARLNLFSALIMYDLDLFKKVNDTYGHMAGDYILCAVADILKSQLRPYDIFARYGGEEFVIFATANEPFDLFMFADRLREGIARAEINYDGNRIPITASFGVTHVPPQADFDDAMRAVDVALYKAKSDGRNRVVVSDEM